MKNLVAHAAILAFIAVAVASGQQPNIVVILSDDQGCNDVGFNGDEFHETPHVDRIAREGMIFTNAYSSCPNCAPTRASLISGMYVPRHLIYTPGGKSKIDPHQMRL